MIEAICKRDDKVVVISPKLCEFFGVYESHKIYHVGRSNMLDILRVYVIDYNPATGLNNTLIRG